MKNNFLQETLVSLALIALLVLFLNPFGFWMPNALLIMMIVGLIVVFALFAGLFGEKIQRMNERCFIASWPAELRIWWVSAD